MSSKPPKKLVAKQIHVAPFQATGGPLSYSVLALGEDGIVYRYDPQCQSWLAWSMEVVGCRDGHPGRR